MARHRIAPTVMVLFYWAPTPVVLSERYLWVTLRCWIDGLEGKAFIVTSPSHNVSSKIK